MVVPHAMSELESKSRFQKGWVTGQSQELAMSNQEPFQSHVRKLCISQDEKSTEASPQHVRTILYSSTPTQIDVRFPLYFYTYMYLYSNPRQYNAVNA
ncbi:unnamed protein product [Phytophthora fragariaefolia]|uniref:Unnamed protein product n=1 Tax=Phytophthora fragariaefolia TaxID=1490495 RepID=A0A9W7CUB9_9STRA|nr:unnamed protein product [Phytophthora fragariaefolia]